MIPVVIKFPPISFPPTVNYSKLYARRLQSLPYLHERVRLNPHERVQSLPNIHINEHLLIKKIPKMNVLPPLQVE